MSGQRQQPPPQHPPPRVGAPVNNKKFAMKRAQGGLEAGFGSGARFGWKLQTSVSRFSIGRFLQRQISESSSLVTALD